MASLRDHLPLSQFSCISDEFASKNTLGIEFFKIFSFLWNEFQKIRWKNIKNKTDLPNVVVYLGHY